MSILVRNNKVISAGGKVLYRVSTPFDLPNLKLYLSATRMVQQTNGSTVPSFLDYSGNLYHATQATTSLQPLFKTNQFGTNAGIKFDGVDDAMNVLSSGALNIFRNINQYTVQCVMKRTTLGDNSRGIYFAQNVSGVYRLFIQLHPTLGLSCGFTRLDGGTLLSFSVPCNDLNTHFIQATLNPTDNNIYLYLDGNLVACGLLAGAGNISNTPSFNIDLGYIQFPSISNGTAIINGISVNTTYSNPQTIQAQYRGYLSRGYL